MDMGKVLVVDDLPDWRNTLSGLLVDGGFSVRSVSSVSEALQAIKDEFFHVALLDVRLDESDEDNRDGIKLMHEIKKNSPSVEIIILTGFADVSMIQEALNPNLQGTSTAFCFLEKNNMSDLMAQVKRACEKSKGFLEYLISQGENEAVEFKSSIRWDFQKKIVNKNLQIAIAKAIAGMLNHKGGIILIGVDDNGRVLGIENDLTTLRKPTIDEFQVAITDSIRSYFGLKYRDLVHVRFDLVSEKQISIVKVDASPEPVYLMAGDEPQLWVRIENSTQRLNVKAAMDYINSHWGKI
jgi:CheY-like chemotaxis protein